MRPAALVLLAIPVLAFTLASGCGAPASSRGKAGGEADALAGEPVALETGSPFRASALATLAEPWAIALEPGTGNLFLTEKGGTARYFDQTSGELRPIGGLPLVAHGGQGGLGDVAFAPDYATSGLVYLTWAKAASATTRQAVAGRGRFSCGAQGCAIAGLEEIWQQQPAVGSRGHFSHRLAFSPDGQHLFISSGDRQQKAPAQDLSNTLGTIVRLTLDGAPAAGNPFAGQGRLAGEIWSYGHRNGLGLGFDPAGRLWLAEHGPAGGDELNLIEAGQNYGWPLRSFGKDYDGTPIRAHSADDGFAKPAIHWSPVIGPGAMIFYDGPMFADWQGQALLANLTIPSIVRVATDGPAGAGAARSAREVGRHLFPRRLRGIAQASDGALWVIEDGPQGRLLRLTRAD